MDTSSKSLTALLATLVAAAVPHTALANSAPFIAPFTEQTISVGNTLQLRVIPSDRDGTVPALHLDNPPPGSRFDDNLDGTRTFVWTPADDTSGVHYFHFTAVDADDPALSYTRSLKVRLIDEDGTTGNQAPSLAALADRQIMLGESFDFRVEASDPERRVPSLTVDPLPQGAVFQDNLDGSRQFIWTPTALSPGSAWLTFTATDADEANLSDSQTIRLQLLDANGALLPGTLGDALPSPGSGDNRAPIIPPLPPQSIALGQSFDFTVRALDVDGTVPLLSIAALPEGASFADNGDGSRRFQWTPRAANLGDTGILIEAIDALDPDVRSSLAFTLTVYRDAANPVNFPPVFTAMADPIIRAGDTLRQRVVAVDPDLSVPALRVVQGPDDAQFVDNLDGSRTLIWRSRDEDIGETTVSFLATDAEHADVQVSQAINIHVVPADSLQPPGERLRTLAQAHGIDIGFSAPRQATNLPDNELFLQLATEEFSLITGQDAFEMNSIHPQRDVFRFDDIDTLAEHAETAEQRLHAQALVTHEPLPAWLLSLAPGEVETAMLEHIDAVAGRYRSRVAIWDVVSEALDDQGRLRESIWTQGMAGDYFARAFTRTRAVDPTAQLIYSDIDVLTENPKSDAMYALLKRELAAGTPIDGVGFKAHLHSSFSDYASLQSNLQRFAELGLNIYITEFAVTLQGNDSLEQQALVYQRVLESCLQLPACKAIQAWGYTDRYSQPDLVQPLLFTEQYQPKPAYEAWQRTLQNLGS